MTADSAPPLSAASAIDSQHPWLGLASYTEETRAFFHGRDEDAAELARRVQRKLLTVLFGQSGHGKTSLLRAGLVPRLRPEGFCPVYVRIDYDPKSPPPSEQIKREVFRATSAAGSWTRTGTSIEGESLWEFLHHRDDTLRDHEGKVLTPILIFDQFEEIFTLAQTDDSGRHRAKEFLADLSNLVENRPPAELEARIDRDEVDAAEFDFARADYRVLIALREDYLAHLEGLKGTMPSVTQNRVRLARFTGPQAVAAVRSAAPNLVSAEVAGQIVQFVSGGTDQASAEVEPSLLSLVCRELNSARLTRGQAEITADLLAGSRETILQEFYERALADQKPGVRRFIEDEMLTDSGYRESIAEERVRKAFAAAGAPSGSLAELVSRRLLRVEERLDMRRVELTHDVLCRVVVASRSVRHEREARDLAERQLVEQRAREAATRRMLVRARAVAAICAVAMLVAAGSAVFGWIGLRRARAADAQAESAKRLAEIARGEAENLVGFLLEDFYDELAPTGRVETIGDLAQRAVTYYDGLPAELRTPLTLRNRGMALVRQAAATLQRGDAKTADSIYAEARAIFEKLRADGDTSEECAIGFALAYYPSTPGSALGRDTASVEKAAAAVRPFATSANGSRRSKLVYADILNLLSSQQPAEQGVATCEEARRVLAGIGATTVSDLPAAAAYADIGDSEARHALALGRLDQAEKLEKEVDDVADRIIAKRPGFLRAMEDRCYAPDLLANISLLRFSYLQALAFAQESERAVNDYVRFNPRNAWGWQMLVLSRLRTGRILYERGKVNDALATLRFAADTEHDGRNTTGISADISGAWAEIAVAEALLGRRDRAEAAVAELTRTGRAYIADSDPAGILKKSTEELIVAVQARVQLASGDQTGALALASASLRRVDAIPDLPGDSLRNTVRTADLRTVAESGLRLSKLDEAERAANSLLGTDKEAKAVVPASDDAAQFRLLKAHILVAEGKAGDARPVIEPVVAYYHKQQAAGATGTNFRFQLARALFVESMTEPDGADGLKARRSQLDEAVAVMGGLSSEAAVLKNAAELKGWITSARADLN